MNDALAPIPCTHRYCLIQQLSEAHDVQIMVFWPLEISAERNKRNRYEWTFYVRNFPGAKGYRLRKRELCQQHHVFFMDMATVEMQSDVIIQEQTDAWMIRNKGKL